MQYTLYGGELSLFTRKLEAALIFYGADFVVARKTPDNTEHIETRSGTHQVPVLLTPENWMIADTTPLLRMLDGRFPGREMFPADNLGVLVHVLEEYLDEWVARVMVHYRWHYPDSARFAAQRMSGGDEAAAARVMSWGPRACRATGTASPHQQQAAEAEYQRILEAAERQLGETAFLLGDRPTAVDCIVLGGLRAHTNMDPDPKQVVARYPNVVAWAEQRADAWAGGGALAPFPESTAFARQLLSEMHTTYGPFAIANGAAQTAGAKAFHVQTYGEDVSYLSRAYPELSRRMVVEHIHSSADPAAVEQWLAAYQLDDIFR